MRIVYNCSCGQVISVPAEAAGQRARCPKCRQVSWVPAQGAAAQATRPLARPLAAESGALAGRVCSVCQSSIAAADAACLCPGCRSPFHRDCWDQVGGCATYGCKYMPEQAKAPSGESAAAGWGDVKPCPGCGREIRSSAVKCRFCRARLPGPTPMTREEYHAWLASEAQVRPARIWAIVLFALSLVGCLAPAVLIASGIWYGLARKTLRNAGAVYQALTYAAMAISVVYTFAILVFVVFSPAQAG